MTSRLHGDGKIDNLFYSVCVNWAGMALYYATPYMGWHVGGPGMRAGQQSHSCTHVSHDDCTGLGMSAARLTDYHGAECMNGNDVHAAGRACLWNTKQEGLQYESYTMHPRLIVTSFPGFVPLNSQKQERYSLKDIYWKKTTLFAVVLLGSTLQRQNAEKW